VAHEHGHSAFRLLEIAHEVETDYQKNMDRLDELEYGRSEYLTVLGRNMNLAKDMFRISASSVMMFQAMMEALVNHSLASEEKLEGVEAGKFKTKWTKSLLKLGQDPSAFLNYYMSIYEGLRIPLIHPKSSNLTAFDQISFSKIYSGYWSGWEAYRQLFEGLGHPHDDESWALMCNAYNLPTELDKT
jgi:hypothetical protein